MVKGCQRRIIMLKDTGSRYFDSAYFILRSELPRSCSEQDMLREAQHIVDGCVPEPFSATEPMIKSRSRAGRRSYDSLIAYFSGAATVGAVAGAIALIANLLY